MSVLEVENLSFSYGNPREKFQKQVLENINIQVSAGESIGLIGENGAGKSTFLKLLTGLLGLEAGMVRVAGLDRRT